MAGIKSISSEVVVLGGGPAGICAALSAARHGAEVTLIERYGCLGGMMTLGLVGPVGATRSRTGRDFGGIMRELLEDIREKSEEICLADSNPRYSPHCAKYVFIKKLTDAGVNILLHSWVFEVLKEGDAIKSVGLCTKNGRIQAFGKVFIDCTGDGDILALAGAPFSMGSEPESLKALSENALDTIHDTGNQKADMPQNTLQPAGTLFTMGNVDYDAAKDYINRDLTFADFHMDKALFQSPPYSDCTGFEPDPDSDALALPQGRILFFPGRKKGEVIVNMSRVTGTDPTDPFSLSRAEIQCQLQTYAIITFLREHVFGFKQSYFIESPATVGIRESRRLKGQYVLSGDDAINCRKFDDGIACGSYIIDIHDPTGRRKAIGGAIKGDCYQIPLRSLLCDEVTNLVAAGRCLSCDHVAHSSLRVIGTCMLTGQAAGTAAALAVKSGTKVNRALPQNVRQELINDGVFLD